MAEDEPPGERREEVRGAVLQRSKVVSLRWRVTDMTLMLVSTKEGEGEEEERKTRML